MGARLNLLNMLLDLPDIDTVDKRKAFVSFLGFPDLAIYIDWQGATVEFVPRLVDELVRRGQATMLLFIKNLPNSKQVADVARQNTAQKLLAEVQALSDAAWGQEFGAAPPVPAGRQPDLDMLAMTTISKVLVPYYKGPSQAVKPAAAAVAARVEQGLGADPSTAALLPVFKQTPAALEAALVPLLKLKLTQDAALAADLGPLVAKAIEEQTPGPGEINVTQKVRLIKGEVIGAAINVDVVKLGYVSINIDQEADTVEENGRLVGWQGNIG